MAETTDSEVDGLLVRLDADALRLAALAVQEACSLSVREKMLLEAARQIVWFDFSDDDDDVQLGIKKLREAITSYNKPEEPTT